MGDYKMKQKCNICNSEIDDDYGDTIGNFGIYPVAFCVWCVSFVAFVILYACDSCIFVFCVCNFFCEACLYMC